MMSYFNQYPTTAPSPHSPYLQHHQHLQLQQPIVQQQNGYSSLQNSANLSVKSESPETMRNLMENNTAAAAAAIALQNPNNFQHLIRNSMYDCSIKDPAASLIGSAPSPSQAAAATAAAALSMSMGYVPSAAAAAAMWTSTTGSAASLSLDTQSQINSQLQHSVM